MNEDKTVLVNLEEETEFKQEEVFLSEIDKAYLELGKAYYKGKYEDPLPELVYYFDRIKRLENIVTMEKEDFFAKKEEIVKPKEEKIEIKVEEEQATGLKKILRDLPNLNPKTSMSSQQSDGIERCPKCNRIRKKGGRFCSNCGHEF
ncbi:MAG: hypothetical protein ACI4UK_04145 [Floccifex sp.]